MLEPSIGFDNFGITFYRYGIPQAWYPEKPKRASFHVTSNASSAEEAVQGLSMRVGLLCDLSKIGAVIKPVDCRIRAVWLGKEMTLAQVLREHSNIVTLAEFLACRNKFQEAQTKARILGVWKNRRGRISYGLMGYTPGGSHFAALLYEKPDQLCAAHCCVLVRK